MITSLSILSDKMRKRFVSGQFDFTFSRGINFLIGSNGAGKSTLFDLIEKGDRAIDLGECTMSCSGPCEVRSMRMQSQGRSSDIYAVGTSRAGFRHGLASQFVSHGQSNWPLLKAIESLSEGSLVLIDEPEQALDFKRLIELRKLLAENAAKFNFIIATHNPILLWIPGANIINLDVDADYLKNLMSAYNIHSQC
jgi:predicted ATPase